MRLLNTQTIITAYGSLLQSLDMLRRRAQISGDIYDDLNFSKINGNFDESMWNSILDCIYTDKCNKKNRGSLSQEHPAFIADLAQEILYRTDDNSMESGETKNSKPLRSIFCKMNDLNGEFYIEPNIGLTKLKMPDEQKTTVSQQIYAQVYEKIVENLKTVTADSSGINKFINLLERLTSTLPSDSGEETQDISFYDKLKITAAAATCISEYLISQNVTDLKARLADKENFFEEQSFILYSADLSGIQQFIYTVGQSKAEKSLRSRSFFLNLMMEHYIDEILEGCNLSRINLLYSGGGHCYLILPNTKNVEEILNSFNLKFNTFLLKHFGTSIFLAHGWTACTANDIVNIPTDKAPYKAMFKRVSTSIATHKMKRYTCEQINILNSEKAGALRECSVCGRTDNLGEAKTCDWCRRFANLSHDIQSENVYTVSDEPVQGYDFELPSINSNAYFKFTNEQTVLEKLKDGETFRRIYVKNNASDSLPGSINIYVGDYHKQLRTGGYSDKSKGFSRVAICRMDVDNLGRAFVRGFEKSNTDDPDERYRYVTLTRTAAFSRQISLFFQMYINDVLSGKYANKKPLYTTIVYSGGDDVFLIGEWNDVLEAANRIEDAFSTYTCGSLTLSGGFGLFDDKFPINYAAKMAEDLEKRAKSEENKNSICLFDPYSDNTYSWKTYREKVMNEKFNQLKDFFGKSSERGNTALYKIVNLLRLSEQENGRINIARIAYQLAMLEPRKSRKRREDDREYIAYQSFSKNVYKWSLNKTDRHELITAIYLYVYQNRKV